MSIKNTYDPIRNRAATFRLVAQYLNQLRHCVLHSNIITVWISYKYKSLLLELTFTELLYIINMRRRADLYEELLVFFENRSFLQCSEDSLLFVNQIHRMQFNIILQSTSISSKYFALIMFQY